MTPQYDALHVGNCSVAAGAYRVWRSGQAIADGDGSKRLNGTASVDSVATEGYDELSSAAKLALWCVTGGLAIKLGNIAAGDFFQPTAFNYATPLCLIFIPTAAYTASVAGAGKSLSMDNVKQYGAAGTVSYVLVELAFWAVALPVAVGWYRVAEGSWLDLGDPGDKARLLGAGTVFINGVRLLVPLRLTAALALAPWVSRGMNALGSGDAVDDE